MGGGAWMGGGAVRSRLARCGARCQCGSGADPACEEETTFSSGPASGFSTHVSSQGRSRSAGLLRALPAHGG